MLSGQPLDKELNKFMPDGNNIFPFESNKKLGDL